MNDWLLDKAYISTLPFEDKYYLENLFAVVHSYIQRWPIPLVALDYNTVKYDKHMHFSLGNYEKSQRILCSLNINNNINYYDFTCLLEQKVSKYFPHYLCKITHQRPYTKEETIKKIENGADPDKIFNQLKEEIILENAVIDRVILLADTIRININGLSQLRLTLKPVNVFLREVRKLKTDLERYEYITRYTKILQDIKNTKVYELNYSGSMLLNFFKIRIPLLHQHKIKLLDDGRYQWHNFIFEFNSETLKNECMSIYNNFNRVDKELI